MKIIKLDWIDAQSINCRCISREEAKEYTPIMASIVGFLVHTDKDYYILAAEAWEGESEPVKYLHIIPKVLVKKTTVLK